VGLMPAHAGIPQIDVTFEINADGLVKVTAKDVHSGKEQKISVHPSSGLSRPQINVLIQKEREKRAKEITRGKR